MTKTVLITGAGGGIGRACVNHFAKQGWRVIGVDRAEFGEGFPKDGHFIQADISQADSVEKIFHEAKQVTPKLEALVNNAAVQVAISRNKRRGLGCSYGIEFAFGIFVC
jgi:NAD(P)-dependent dehydrogenase (short-subunit alcohol dehydrogenase family)